MKGFKLVLLIVLVAALALVPVFVKKDNIVNLALLVLLYVCLGSSWNILGGYTGQTNLGHAAFFGIGALVTRNAWLGGWPLLPSLLLGGLVAVGFAMLIGIPAFRLRGVYFAIGTLALAQILYITAGNVFSDISSLPVDKLTTYELAPRYHLFLVLAVITVVASFLLRGSRWGLGIMAVREEEDAAESLGVGALQHKLLALTLSAFLAGLAGGGFAFYHVGYYPQLVFSPEWTFDSMMMVYIGGVGTVAGPVFGAVFFVLLRELLALKLPEMHLVVFGVLFILVVLFFPKGFVGAWHSLRKNISHLRKPKEQRVAGAPTTLPRGR